jgi:hypothetical protein
MSMGLAAGSAGGFAPGTAVPIELPAHPLTLDFTPSPVNHPAFPETILPPGSWDDFDEKLWDDNLYALLALREFAALQWTNIAVTDLKIVGWSKALNPAHYQDFVTAELTDLVSLMANERERYMPEILAQHDGAPVYWIALLGLTSGSKPKTMRLVHMALRFGELAVMHFKKQFLRVRPSVLCPGLQPPFGPPGHPAFPSGHALQGWLLTHCLKAVTPQSAGESIYKEQLEWLADRVAVNRERAGFHYRSDSLGGAFIAGEIFNNYLMNNLSACPTFEATYYAAKAEW